MQTHATVYVTLFVRNLRKYLARDLFAYMKNCRQPVVGLFASEAALKDRIFVFVLFSHVKALLSSGGLGRGPTSGLALPTTEPSLASGTNSPPSSKVAT